MLSSNGRLPGHRHRCSTNATVVSARSPENSGRTSENRRATAGGGSAGAASPTGLVPLGRIATDARIARGRNNEDAAYTRRLDAKSLVMERGSAGRALYAGVTARERD